MSTSRPPTERHNYLGNFDPNVNPLTTPAVQQVGPGTPYVLNIKPGGGYLSPRLGMAWDVFGDGKTVVRAGASLMTDASVLGAFIDITPFGANFPSIGVNNSSTAINANTPQTGNFTAAQLNWNTTGATIFPSTLAR